MHGCEPFFFYLVSVHIVDKDCTIKTLKDFFETYVLIDMKIVGTIYSEEEAREVKSIAKLSVVAMRARYLGRCENKQQKNN